MYNDYDLTCIFYLGIEIRKCLLLEEQFLYIDLYLDKIKEIYEDYKKYDNKNKSLLYSIHDYINNNESKLIDKIKDCFE